jgi:hypothetical protein
LLIRKITAALATALAAAACARADAALPSPVGHAIVVGRSIGGVRIGEPLSAAIAAWGPGARCRVVAGTGACRYTGTASTSASEPPYAGFVVRAGRVVEVHLDSAFVPDSQSYLVSGPLAALRTSAGIGIGSSSAAVRAAYPTVRVLAGGVIDAIKTRGVETEFWVQPGRVWSIVIVEVASGSRDESGLARPRSRSQCQAVVCQLSVGDSGAIHGGSTSAT